MAKDPLAGETVPTKKMAEKLSAMLGCSGSHKVGDDAWGPCESDRDLQKLIEVGNPAFREWKARQKKKKTVLDFMELKANKKKGFFNTREEAEMVATRIGCFGAHQVRQGVWAPCGTPEEHNAAHSNAGAGRSRIIRAQRPARRVVTNRRVWENLRGRGPRGIETLPGGGLVSGKSVNASDSFKPTKGMVEEAKRALKWRREFKRGGTAVGIARARDIANGKNLPYKTVKRMKAFFDRHQSDADADGFRPGEDGFPSNGRIAHALWGGDPGYTWAKDIVSRVEGSEKSFKSIDEKRFYTRIRRTEYAKRGWALPDGSYPIRDVGDLRNAIQSYGLGKNKERTRKHIIKRARQLGRLDLVPADWKKRASSKSLNDPKTPAKPSERIYGSSRNRRGSASGTRGGIKLSASVEASLKNKVKEHNEKMEKRGKEERKVTLGMLKAVWRRGAGAFSQTHRPKMGRQQWSMGRVNAFLKLVSSGKPSNPKYTTDNDLLPKKHPRKTKK
jgi:hypothetical protein